MWHEAKLADDYARFAPYIDKIVGTLRRFAGYVRPELSACDYLLNKYEPGLTTETLDRFFANLRESIVPLIARVCAAKPIDESPLHVPFPIDKQRALTDAVMKRMRLDRAHVGVGETEHPFTTNFSKYDVRITTHYFADNFASGMFSTIHEGGHALYESNTGDELAYTRLGEGVSMAVHESQSRFYENIIGRSRAFVSLIAPELRALCPALEGVSEEALYRAFNASKPSLIRTEADADDLTDELIDRFGDPPGAVNALIHVALLRGEAGRAGISDISQKGNMLYFKVENFDMETLSALYAQKEFKNRVKLEAGREPRLGLKLRPGARPIPEARALVEAWNKLQKPAAEPAAEKE